MEQTFKSDSILEQLGNRKNSEKTVETVAENFLIFSLADKLFAFPSKLARSANSIDKIFFFPHVDPWVKGLVNLRGDIHSIIDLRAVLGEEHKEKERMQLLIKTEYAETSVAIDSIIDVMDIDDDAVNKYNEDDREALYISGIFVFKDKNVIILDMELILKDLTERLSNPNG